MSTSRLTLRSLVVALATLGLTTAASAQSAPIEAAPNGAAPAPLYTKITATGSGCPAGSWMVSPASDGESFIVSFRQFRLGMGLSTDTGKMDCLLSVELPSRRGYYSVGDVYSSVNVVSLRSASARVTARAWFTDADALGSVDVLDVPTTIKNKWFVLQPSRSEQPVRSHCGEEHTLNLALDVAITPNPGADPLVADGAISVWEFPTDSAAGLALTWHPCED